MQKYDVDSVYGLLLIARSTEIDFGDAEEPGWFPFIFENNIMYYLWACEDPRRSVVTHPGVPVRCREE